MAQLELWHLVMIVAGLFGFLGLIYLYHVVAIHWEMIALTARAAFRRFVTVPSRQEFLARLADDYVDEEEEAPAARPGTAYRSVPDTNQLEPAGSGLARTGTVPTDEALIRLLAGLQKPSGAWALSANKVAAAVGGERESALVIIREVRGLPDPAPPADPRFPESTKDGRPVASHLRGV